MNPLSHNFFFYRGAAFLCGIFDSIFEKDNDGLFIINLLMNFR